MIRRRVSHRRRLASIFKDQKRGAAEKHLIENHVDTNGNYLHNDEDSIWGYNDEMMKNEDKKFIKVLHKH
jgi:hypothetical protein